MNKTEVVDYIKKSFELKNNGYFKPAIEMLYKALSLDSDNIEILAQLAQLYMNLDNYPRAFYYVEKVLELDKNHIDSLFLLKKIYLLQENNQEAKCIIEKICTIQPNSEILAEKIKILAKLGEFEEISAIEALSTELDDKVLYEIARAYFENQDKEKAAEMLTLGYNKNKKNEDILLLLAVIHYEHGDFQSSKNLFHQLEEIGPTAEVMNYLGLFKLNEKNFTTAVAYFSKAHKADKKNHEYIYNLASAYFLKGMIEEALKYFTQAVCMAPEKISYHYSLAYLYYHKKAFNKAKMELDYIKSLDKNHEQSNILSAMVTAKKGDPLAAKNQLEEIVKADPTDDFAISALSKVYKELSQVDLAKYHIKMALELNPDSLDYLSDLTEIKIDQKDYENAKKIIQKMLELNKKYIYAHIALSKINFDLKDFDAVFDCAQSIIKLDQSCPEGYYYNALSLFESGDKDFAIASLKKAISLDLNNHLLYLKMSEFYQEMGYLKKAYEWALEASEIDDKSYQYKWLCAKLANTLHMPKEASKHYSQSYRLASFDKDLKQDYANYLVSIGKDKQAKAILN